MKFQIKRGSESFNDLHEETIVLFVFEDEKGTLDTLFGGQLKSAISIHQFDGLKMGLLPVMLPNNSPVKQVILGGLGKKNVLTPRLWIQTMGSLSKKIKKMSVQSIGVMIPEEVVKLYETTGEVIKQTTIASILGRYEFTKYKKESQNKKDIDQVFSWYTKEAVADGNACIEQAETVSKSVMLARDLVNESPSVTTPSYLADEAKKLAQGSDMIQTTVFDKEKLTSSGMGGILAIGQGSKNPPILIELSYTSPKAKKTIVIVGKGITFDSGGLSLKPSQSMETMKLDMAGASVIFGVFNALKHLKPSVNVIGLVPSAENMPSGSAIKPGDVVKTYGGKSIEILNTDAEGRVILSDALAYASSQLHPDAIIDLATLTGACVVALGEEIAGIFSTEKKLTEVVTTCSTMVGEPLWELPLFSEYRELLDSPVADIKNIAKTRWGGAIEGALFLKDFVDESIPWVHLDIAGPAYAEKDTPLAPHGATGFGVQTILAVLEALSK